MDRVLSLSSLLRIGVLLGLVAMIPIHASCAADGAAAVPSDPDSGTPPEAGSGADAASDAPSDDDGAVAHPCAEVDWCPVATGVDPVYTLTAVWGSGAHDVWAVGSGGTAVHWAGDAWSPVTTGTTSTLLGVWGSGPNDVWAVATAWEIFHSTGASSVGFSLVPEAAPWPTGARLYTVWGTSASDVRVGGAPARVYTPEDGEYVGTFNHWRKAIADGGVGWQPISSELSNLTILGMWGSSSDDVWIVGDNSLAVPAGTAGTVVHVRSMGEDGGAPSFDLVDGQSVARLEAIWGSSARDVWAVGVGGRIRRYSEGARRFAIVDSPVTADLHAVWGTGPNDVWAVGAEGTILHFDGVAWTVSSTGLGSGQEVNLTGIWGSGPNDVWAVGGNVALHFTGTKSRAGASK